MNDYTSICTVRHGQTEYGPQKRYAGSTDVLLSIAGVEDTKNAAKKLFDMRFDAVITSTLMRSIETARLLLGDDVKFTQCSLCDERNYGVMQGLTEDEVQFIKPKVEFIKAGDDYHSLNPAQGETFEMLRKRAKEFRRLIFSQYRNLTVLIVSHGVFLQQFHGLLRGLNWRQALATNVQNLEFNMFVFKGTYLVKQSTLKLVDRDQCNW